MEKMNITTKCQWHKTIRLQPSHLSLIYDKNKLMIQYQANEISNTHLKDDNNDNNNNTHGNDKTWIQLQGC